MKNDPSCIFCKIVAGTIPAKECYRDERCVAFHDVNPQAPTHVLVIPAEHIASLGDATDEHSSLLGHLLTVATKLAGELGVKDSGFRAVINTGRDGGQSVHHLHLHLLAGRALTWPPG